MTSARRKRKQYGLVCAVLLGAAAALLALTPLAQAGLTGRIVVDWHTGLALSGYDPVAFFTDSRALTGSAEIELRHDGVIWRFRNVGNRAAFAERPDVYMPRYGGYDPVDVARGVAVAGNPLVWAILGERLFLFYDRAQREKFTADPARYVAAADRKWPAVMRTLDP